MGTDGEDVLADVIETLGLPADAVVVPAPGGASGSAWKVSRPGESFVLRLSSSVPLMEGRLAAMGAARAAGLPAPELVRRARVTGHEAVLLAWLPGVTLLDALVRVPRDARHWGRAMGHMQRRLHGVSAPPEVTAATTDPVHAFSAGRDVPGLPDGDALIHLDWHPLNLLVNEESREICGIVDWDNAQRGHPLLDLARTESILTVDPGLASLPHEVRAGLGALIDGWVDGYGAAARQIPPACRVWAGRVMLADRGARYRGMPALLDPLRRSIERSMEQT